MSSFGRLALAAGLALVMAGGSAYAAVKTWLDSNQVAPGDSVQLTLEYEGQTNSAPDLSPLERDFDVLGSSRTTTFEMLNGSTSTKTRIEVTLSPKHAGRLTVPSISWGGDRSPALALDVSASAGGSSAGSGNGVGAGTNGGGTGAGGIDGGAQSSGAASDRPVFLQTEFDPAQPYVQAAVTVTVRLYTREALYNPSLTFSETHDVLIRQVGSDESGRVTRGGESYDRVTRHYVVFPQRSGSLTIPGPVLDAQVPMGSNAAGAALNDPFAGLFGPTFGGNVFSMSKPIRLHGTPIALDVRPRPSGTAGGYWMPASEVTLSSAWHPASLQAQAGDPMTVDLDLRAVGLTAAQLPDLSQLLQLPAGLKAYPDEAKLSDSASGDTIVGTRTQSIALIADQPGHFTLPALRLRWWDTQTNRAREALLPARTFVVAPAAGSTLSAQSALPPQVRAPGQAVSGAAVVGAAPSPGAPNASGTAPGRGFLSGRGVWWLGLSVALALAWLATLGAWWRVRKGAVSERRFGRPAAPELTPASVAAPGAVAAPAAPFVVAGASAARAAFRLACQRNEATDARRYLLAWVRATWPDSAPTGLNALARQVDDPGLATLVRELDRACYAGEAWSGQALSAALAGLPRRKRGSADQTSDLEQLYP